MATVTVIIPVLNGMPYLPEMLASLEAQSYRDFLVLLWDNGSTDGTVEEAQKWIPSRLPGQVISGQALPLHACLARMVEMAESELIARMDADDICFPDRFALQVRYLADHPEVAVLGGQVELIGGGGEHIEAELRFPVERFEIYFSFLFRNPISHPTVVFRRQAILEVGNYAVEKPVEDYDLWMRVATRFVIANLSETLLKYRRHTTAVCGEWDSPPPGLHDKMIESVVSLCKGLFGLRETTYLALRAKRHPLAVLGLLPVFIRAIWIGAPLDLIRSPTVTEISRCLTKNNDYVSKLVWRLFKLFQ